MLDPIFRPIIHNPLDAAGRWLAGIGLSPIRSPLLALALVSLPRLLSLSAVSQSGCSGICSPDPPISAGKSLNFGSPSRATPKRARRGRIGKRVFMEQGRGRGGVTQP